MVASLNDMSNFNKLVDRMQQGLRQLHVSGTRPDPPDGMSTDPAFEIDPDGAGSEDAQSVIDTDGGRRPAQFMGISQGGIMGGALTALEPDVDRSVLNVPGMNYSTLLRRSVDSDEYFKTPGLGLYANYPNELERPLLLSLIQLLWDRGEGNGYAHNMTTHPLPNTNPHEVLLQPAIGDHQVANVTAEVEARTIGASVYTPALEPGRHWEENPFLGIPQVDVPATGPYTGGSMLVYYDGGPLGFVGNSRRRNGHAAERERPAAARVGIRRRSARLPAQRARRPPACRWLPGRRRDRPAARAPAATASATGIPAAPERGATIRPRRENGRMRVSAKADYAVRAAVELAAAGDGEPVKGTVISKSQKIPLRFLENILGELRHAGIVQSQRGSEGGYWLARTADDITIAEIIRAVEGPLASVRGERPEDLEYLGDAEPLREVWVALRANIRQILESVTLADVVADELPAPVVEVMEGHPEVWESH